MSKLIRKLSKVLNTRQKDVKKDSESDDEDDLQVDAIPTSTAVVPRLTEEHDFEDIPAAGQPMNQANQFNSPNQMIYQFNSSHGIHIGNALTINQNITQEHHIGLGEDDEDNEVVVDASPIKEKKPQVDSKVLRKKFPKTRTIELLLKCKLEIEHAEMDVIATHLGEDWRSVARDLGFSNGEIDHFYEDNFAYGVKEVIYKILTEWKQREEEPEIGKLCQILWTRDIHREVVYKLKLDYKRRQQ